MLLAFGLQDRRTVTDIAIEQARTMHVRATTAFPHASIWIPLINTAPGLPREEKDNVVRLNHFFTTISSTIPLLPEHQFQTTADHIFWTPPTAQAILTHWSNFLNLVSPSVGTAPVERKGLLNLSSHFRPSEAQVSLLLKGLSFVPTLNIGRQGPPSMRLEVAAYHRRLKLAAFFEGQEQTDPSERRRFLPPSAWTPKDHQLPPIVPTLVQADLGFAASLPNGEDDTPNLTPEEVVALRQLRQDPHLDRKSTRLNSSH